MSTKNTLITFYKNHFTLVLLIVIALLTLLAWTNRFIQDDAFISFRYAQHLVEGKGLVWNVGEKVEGYTNFLWVLIIAFILNLGIDPVSFCFFIGPLLLAASLFFTYKTAFLMFQSKHKALLTIILLGTNYSFSAYATGGLETQLQALLFISSFYLFTRSFLKNIWPDSTLLTFSLLATAALLTRLDSSLFLIILFPAIIVFIFKQPISFSKKLIKSAILITPMSLITGTWLIWKLSYYGDIFPNTFYLKAQGTTLIFRGIYYVSVFFLFYYLFIFPILWIKNFKQLRTRLTFPLLFLFAFIFIWIIYIIKVGGDFMEFRFFIPILPHLFILFLWTFFIVIRQKKQQRSLIATLIICSFCYALFFSGTKGTESIKGLKRYITKKHWPEIGKILGKSLKYSPDITIAVSAAGAIPYYSRLKTIDVLGLNDAWVARHGIPFQKRPAHTKIATGEYLLQRKVNLVIEALPIDVPTWNKTLYAQAINKRFSFVTNAKNFPSDAKILEIPLNEKTKITMLYILKNPTIEEAIKKYKWNVSPLSLTITKNK